MVAAIVGLRHQIDIVSARLFLVGTDYLILKNLKVQVIRMQELKKNYYKLFSFICIYCVIFILIKRHVLF
jgi:hypothetical protein